MSFKRLGNFLLGNTTGTSVPLEQIPAKETEIGAFVQRSTINRAHSFVELINVHMQRAHAAKIVKHRRSYSRAANLKLGDLKQLIEENAYIRFENLEDIERQLAEIEFATDEMEEGAQGKNLAAFQKLSLSKQCDALSLPLEVVYLERLDGHWVVAGVSYRRPEDAALAHLVSFGWQGLACEGKATLLLMKASCLEQLVSLNIFGSREDAAVATFEAQVSRHRDHHVEIISAIQSADEKVIRKNLSEIFSWPMYNQLNPVMDKEILVRIWRVMSPKLLAKLAQYICDEHHYRAGWPDLTLVRESGVRFVEVKTTDKFHASQLQTILDVLKPENTDIGVIQIKPKPNLAQL
jgi:hypothetical protein